MLNILNRYYFHGLMFRFLGSALLLTFGMALQAQSLSPEKLGWRSYRIETNKLGIVHYFVSGKETSQYKPVLLYLDGSGSAPLYSKSSSGVRSVIPADVIKLSEQYSVIVISKPGIPFADTLAADGHSLSITKPMLSEYDNRLSLEWRVAAANIVLRNALKHLKVNPHQITVLGISEGFQVGAQLLTINHQITSAILMMGNGLSQFYDFILEARSAAKTGLISETQAQHQVDSLLKVFQDIYTDSGSVTKKWRGHTYLRWSSFARKNPSQNLSSVNIPLYIVAGSKDQNTTVESADYLYLESIRMHKQNVTYKVYPYDHSMNEVIKEEDGKEFTKSHRHEVFENAFQWLKNQR